MSTSSNSTDPRIAATFRIERDSFGAINVPATRLWGA